MKTVENVILPEGICEILVDAYGQEYWKDAGSGQLYRKETNEANDHISQE